jgi:hypothetical protein
MNTVGSPTFSDTLSEYSNYPGSFISGAGFESQNRQKTVENRNDEMLRLLKV